MRHKDGDQKQDRPDAKGNDQPQIIALIAYNAVVGLRVDFLPCLAFPVEVIAVHLALFVMNAIHVFKAGFVIRFHLIVGVLQRLDVEVERKAPVEDGT